VGSEMCIRDRADTDWTEIGANIAFDKPLTVTLDEQGGWFKVATLVDTKPAETDDTEDDEPTITDMLYLALQNDDYKMLVEYAETATLDDLKKVALMSDIPAEQYNELDSLVELGHVLMTHWDITQPESNDELDQWLADNVPPSPVELAYAALDERNIELFSQRIVNLVETDLIGLAIMSGVTETYIDEVMQDSANERIDLINMILNEHEIEVSKDIDYDYADDDEQEYAVTPADVLEGLTTAAQMLSVNDDEDIPDPFSKTQPINDGVDADDIDNLNDTDDEPF